MSDHPIFTYQTRIELTETQAGMLSAYAALYGQAERSLFAAMRAGGTANDLKRAFLPRFGLTARQFNAIRVGLDGKIVSIKERRPELIAEAETRIKRAGKVMPKLQARAPGSNRLHQKKRRLSTLRAHLAAMKSDHESGAVRLCFGSKRSFRAEVDLAANGYASHGEWKAHWRAARSSQFSALGSGDETAGNQTCQARLEADGSLTLCLRLPNGLAPSRKIMELPGVRFAYGHDAIVAALSSSRRIAAQTKAGKSIVKRTGAAISYRFLRDERGWRVFASVEAQAVNPASRHELGAVGIDVNADHLAGAETDRFGNLVKAFRIALPLYGKTADQAKALIGDACVAMANCAQAAGKPVVIEELNFQKKKAGLEAVDPRQARMLSSFACNQVIAGLKAACFRAGVEVIKVNPAYASVIGAVNSAQPRGISVHQGAALAIARRGLGFSERPTVRQAIVPARNGGHVTFDLPVRNRSRHVWSFWSAVRTKLKAAHAAHYRSGEAKAKPAPLISATRSVCAHRSLPAKFRHANRDQHCSDHVLDDIPW